MREKCWAESRSRRGFQSLEQTSSSVTPLIKYIYVLCAVFHHPESVPYAFELLNGTELFGQRIRLQNKATGLGESCWRKPLQIVRYWNTCMLNKPCFGNAPFWFFGFGSALAPTQNLAIFHSKLWGIVTELLSRCRLFFPTPVTTTTLQLSLIKFSQPTVSKHNYYWTVSGTVYQHDYLSVQA